MSSGTRQSWESPITHHGLFQSFFMGGFECSTFKLPSGKRLDLIDSTRHDQFAESDYALLAEQGIRTVREGVRWHLVEQNPGHYDFSSVEPLVHAARAQRAQIIWDVCHFGWPDHIDLFSADFISKAARFAAALARWLQNESDGPSYFVPMNEISFFSWAGGDAAAMEPYQTGRGFELKVQLIRASIAIMEAIWSVAPDSRFVHVDPLVNVVAHPSHPEDAEAAEAYRLSQYQAWDMLAGRLWPGLGGREEFLDIIGVNYYPHNQWFYDIRGTKRSYEFEELERQNPCYRPLRAMLREVHDRYKRPIIIAETGTEDEARPGWFNYVYHEAAAALDEGVPLEGICLYPILNHPGWVDDRHCHNGLWDYADDCGNREIYEPLAEELHKARKFFDKKLGLEQMA